MEPKQEEKRPSRAELEKLALQLNELLGDKMKDHVDGDAEEYLFKMVKKRRG